MTPQAPPSATGPYWAPSSALRVECGCAIHFISGAFAPNRNLIRLSSGEAAQKPPSLGDLTPKERSRHCTLDGKATAGLYERVPPTRAVVFRNAHVLTMRSGVVLEGHDVIVRGERIESVQPTGAPLPTDAVVVEASGKTLIPGLSEMHAHLFVGTWAQAFAPMVENGGDGSQYMLPYDLLLFQLLSRGITRLEVMAGCPDALWMRDSIRAGKLAGPRLSVGSPLIDGPPSMHSPTMSYVVGDREGGYRAGQQIADMGFDFAKPYSGMPAEGYEGLMSACEQRGIRVMGHVPRAVGVEAAIRRGQRGIAHAAELFYNETGPERRDPARRERLVRQMADAGVSLQATVVVTRRMSLWGGFEGPLVAPDREHMNPLQKALWDENSPIVAAMRLNTAYKPYYEDSFNLSCLVTSDARAAGVRVLTGTDFPNPYVVEGHSLHEELQLFVERCGYTPMEALFASTRHAAEYDGNGPADGTVGVGGRADLVLLDADPLADISATRSVNTVLAGGVLLRQDQIEEGLARVRQAYDAMPPARAQVPTQHEYVKQPDR